MRWPLRITKRLDGTSSHMCMLSLTGGSIEVSLLMSLAGGGGSGRAGAGWIGVGRAAIVLAVEVAAGIDVRDGAGGAGI